MPVIRQQRQFFSQAVGVADMNTGGQDAANVVAAEADRLSGEAFKLAAEDAEKSGIDLAQAMEEGVIKSIDPETGMPTAFKQEAGGRIARQAYERVIDRRFEEAIDRDLRLASKRIAMDNPSPSAYKAAYSSYVAGLGEGATGKYGEFIKSTGSALLASTELTLIGQARSRARAGARSARASSNKQAVNFLFALAQNGMDAQAVELLSLQSGIAQDEITAGLADPGLMSQIDSKLKGAVAEGAAVRLMTELEDDEAGRNAVDIAIQTGGAIREGIPEELNSTLDLIIGMRDGTNAAGISAESNRLNSAFNRRDAMLKEQAKLEEERLQRLSLIEADIDVANFRAEMDREVYNTARDMGNMVTDRVGPHIAYSYPEFSTKSELSARMSANILRTEGQLGEIIAGKQQAFVDGVLDESDYRSQKDEFIRAWLDPYGNALAAMGNIEALHAVADGDVAAMAQLAPEQRSILTALYKTDTARINSEVIKEGLKDTFDRGDQAAREKLEQAAQTADWYDSFGKVTSELEKGVDGGDRTTVNELDAQIDAMVSSGRLTAVQGAAKKKEAEEAWSVGLANLVASNPLQRMNSQQVDTLARYLTAKGLSDPTGLSQDALGAAELILAASPESIKAVNSHLTTLAEKLRRSEADAEDAAEEQRKATRIYAGQGDGDSKADQKVAQELLFKKFQGIDSLYDPLSVDSRIYQEIESMGVLPVDIVTAVSNFAKGAPGRPEDMAVMIEHYRNLSEVERNGMAFNLFRGAMAEEHIAVMDSVLSVADATGMDPFDILVTKYNSEADVEKVLPDGARDFVADELGDDIGKYAMDKLAPTVLHLAKLGFTDPQIREHLEDLGGQFVVSEFVYDPNAPKAMTDAAPELMMTAPQLEQMVKIIQSELPEGYYLNRGGKPATTGFEGSGQGLTRMLQQRRENRSVQREGLKPVFMVPDKTGGPKTGIWELWTVDEYGSLTPLIYDRPTENPEVSEPYWPRFNMFQDEAFEAFNADQAAKKAEEDASIAQEAQDLKRAAVADHRAFGARVQQLGRGEILPDLSLGPGGM